MTRKDKTIDYLNLSGQCQKTRCLEVFSSNKIKITVTLNHKVYAVDATLTGYDCLDLSDPNLTLEQRNGMSMIKCKLENKIEKKPLWVECGAWLKDGSVAIRLYRRSLFNRRKFCINDWMVKEHGNIYKIDTTPAFEEQEKRKHALEKERNELAEKVKTMTKELERLSSAYEEVKEQNTNIGSQIARLREDNAEYKENNQRLKDENKRLNEELSKLKDSQTTKG